LANRIASPLACQSDRVPFSMSKTKLAANDPYVWSDPVEVVKVNGDTYVVNGHHRLAAVADPATGYTGNVPYTVLTEAEAKAIYGFDPSNNFGRFGGSGSGSAP
jgi:hypothetical protein